MKRLTDDAYSRENGIIDQDEDLLESDSGITGDAEAADSAPEKGESEITEEFVFSSRSAKNSPSKPSGNTKMVTSDDMADYKFLKRRSTGSHHSSGSYHSSGSRHASDSNESDSLYVSSNRSSSKHHSSGSHHSHHHHKKKMKTWKKVLIIVVSVILALVICIVTALQVLWLKGRSSFFDVALDMSVPDTISAEVQDNGEYIIYKGEKYKYNKEVTNILFMGVDKRSIDSKKQDETGGQADTIVMIAMNMKDRVMNLIAPPRDTVTDVAVYTQSGHYNGMKKLQVCLAYAYGDGKSSSCENTVSSVKNIFYNVPINTYFALDLDGIAEVNDAVGGVDVVSPQTIGQFNEGESYHLEGSQAEKFVRDRTKTEVGASMKRLDRQKVYARSFMSTMTSAIKKDITKAVSVYNETAPYSCTNLNAAKVTYLASEFVAGKGMSSQISSVPGKISLDESTGLARYDIDQEKFFELFLSVYYEKVNK